MWVIELGIFPDKFSSMKQGGITVWGNVNADHHSREISLG